MPKKTKKPTVRRTSITLVQDNEIMVKQSITTADNDIVSSDLHLHQYVHPTAAAFGLVDLAETLCPYPELREALAVIKMLLGDALNDEAKEKGESSPFPNDDLPF